MSDARSRFMSRLPLYLGQLNSGMVWVTIGPLLDSILRDLHIPLSQGGLPALAYFLGTVVGLVSFNVFFARLPVKQCLFLSALLSAAGLAASGLLAQNLWSFLVPYFVVGFANVIVAAIPGMWVSAHVKENTAGALTVMMMCGVSTMIAAPVVLGLLLSLGAGWRWLLTGEAVMTLAFAVAFLALPLADIQGRESLRLRHLRAIAGFNPRLLAAIAGAAFMYLGAEMTLTVWLPKFEIDVFGATATWAGFAVTFYFLGQLFGRFAAIPLTRRFLASSLLMTCVILLAAFSIAVGLSGSQAGSLVLTFLAGLGSSAAFSFIASYASKFPAWYAGVVFSVFQLCGGVGAMAFPYLTGPVAASLGFRVAIAAAAVPAVIVAVIAIPLRRASGEATPAPARSTAH